MKFPPKALRNYQKMINFVKKNDMDKEQVKGGACTDGTRIPRETVIQSNLNKAKRKQTLAQLPVYRAAGNLKFVVAQITMGSPRSLRRFFDLLTEKVEDLSSAIGYADMSTRYSEDRVSYINTAIVTINNVRQDIAILSKLSIISKDRYNKMMSHSNGVLHQLLAWRETTCMGEGSARHVVTPLKGGGL